MSFSTSFGTIPLLTDAFSSFADDDDDVLDDVVDEEVIHEVLDDGDTW